MLEARLDLAEPTSATSRCGSTRVATASSSSLPIGGPGAIRRRGPADGRRPAPGPSRRARGRWRRPHPGPSISKSRSMDRGCRWPSTGRSLFDPIDYDDPAVGPPLGESPVALGVRAGAVVVGDLRLYRDVHYTERAGQHPAPAVRGRFAVSARHPTSSSCWATTARSRTTRGSGRPAPSCRANCSSASRSWSTCRARSFRSRSSAGRFTGFPIPAKFVTFVDHTTLDRSCSHSVTRGTLRR